jgi:hypothetical protein
MSLFLMFRFQVSMVGKEGCYFVENVGRVDEDIPSTTLT